MQITVIADRSVFDAAIAAAELPIPREGQYALNAPLDGVLSGRVEDAWDKIRDALTHAYEQGKDGARSVLDEAQAAVDSVMASAGSRAREVASALRAKLRSYVATFIDEMLKQVRPSILVGADSLRLSEVHLTQKVVLSGSLKASLTEAFELTSNGEFQVEATYRFDGAMKP
jgi:hypothetical protein